MEFDFDCSQVLAAKENGIAVIDGQRSLKKGPQHYAAGVKVHPYQKLLNEVVDKLGDASASAQGLSTSITNSIKFFNGEDRMYLLVDGFKILGMLKMGTKKLFIRDEIGNVKEIEPLCVLDFYVHESCQRSGYGKYLFEYMLDNENTEPHKLAYDRPSYKLLAFLKKHYGLSSYVPQANNFVVFSSYFALDKNYKTFYKDPIKPREKVAEPPKMQRQYEDNNYDNYQGYSQQPQPSSGQMPSYKEAMEMNRGSMSGQNYNESFQQRTDDASAYPSGYPQEHEQYRAPQESQAQDYNAQYKQYQEQPDQLPEATDTQRKVRFDDSTPQVYNMPSEGYAEESYNPPHEEHQYQQQNNFGTGYDEYSGPAGRNYTNPNIEQDQYQRKFNRTKHSFETNDTFKDVFSHPEGEGPLSGNDPRGQKIPVEFNIKKTNQKINDTEEEIKKCEDRLKNLEMRSTQLSSGVGGLDKGDKFLGKEQKQLFSTEKDFKKPDMSQSSYNKRFGYSTVYDNKFKNIAKDPNVLDSDRGNTLSNAGSKLMAQNPNLNVYQHQQLIRSSPFGSTGDSSYSKMTSSSAYGSFFGKRKF